VAATFSVNEPVDLPPAPVPLKYTLVDYLFQFIIITAGVLIALLANGLVEWNRNRELVAEARATIAREIADNKKDLDATLDGMTGDLKKFDAAIQFAAEMLRDKKTSVTTLDFSINMADVSSTSWRTAERTGALGHMDYDEVQRYSKLYDLQELLVEQQRSLVSRLGEATAILSGDFNPDNPNPKDLEFFRERVMVLRAQLAVHEQMAKRLAENYAEALKKD
jgi:hypothetical protein